jgi:hypothetical protein
MQVHHATVARLAARPGRLSTKSAGVSLDATCRDQQQDYQQDEAETSATVVAGPVERPAAPVSKTAEKRDDEDDQENGAKCHELSFRRMTS